MKICLFTLIARTNNHVDMEEVLVVPSRVEHVAYRVSLKTALEPIPVVTYPKMILFDYCLLFKDEYVPVTPLMEN